MQVGLSEITPPGQWNEQVPSVMFGMSHCFFRSLVVLSQHNEMLCSQIVKRHLLVEFPSVWPLGEFLVLTILAKLGA